MKIQCNVIVTIVISKKQSIIPLYKGITHILYCTFIYFSNLTQVTVKRTYTDILIFLQIDTAVKYIFNMKYKFTGKYLKKRNNFGIEFKYFKLSTFRCDHCHSFN